MKNSQWIGIAAAVLVVAASFLPWAFFPDLQKTFTGFFSESNRYGRPGKVLFFFSVIEIVFYLIPRIWAKRANIFVTAISLAWAAKCYITYTACYRGTCPTSRPGLYLVLAGAAIAVIAALLPDVPIKEEEISE
jgi:hypothetical protein